MISKKLKISMFLSLSGREKILFLEAFLLHLWVGLLIKVIPFRWIPRLFRSPQSTVGSPQSAVFSHKGGDLQAIKQAIGRANLVSPWKNKCLVSALAARRMLRRRKVGSELSLGLARDRTDRVTAHAWLKTGDFEIVEKGGDFTVLYTF